MKGEAKGENLLANDGSGSGGGGGVDGAGEDGVCSVKRGPLPWREEKRLGFRAACLRDWLLDAAR